MTDDALDALCEHDEFTSLHTLHIHASELEVSAMHELASAPFANQLVELSIRRFEHGDQGDYGLNSFTQNAWLKALEMLSKLGSLKRLYLTELGITNKTLEALGMHNPWPARLDELEFYRGLQIHPNMEAIKMFLQHAKLSDPVRQSFENMSTDRVRKLSHRGNLRG